MAAALLPRDLKEKVRGDTSGGTEQMRRVDRIDSPDVVAMETSIARRPAVAAEKESATAVGGRGRRRARTRSGDGEGGGERDQGGVRRRRRR